jgi:hypothetical protein
VIQISDSKRTIVQEGRVYNGIVERWIDPENRGRYKVRIPDLGAYEQQFVVINNVHSWSHSVINNQAYGSYYPLFPNTNVNVIFKKTGDATSGVIISIIPDGSTRKTFTNNNISTIPLQSTSRDDVYVLMNTRRLNSGIWFFDSSDKFSRSTHYLYNSGASGMIMSDSGIELFTNSRHTVLVESSHLLRVEQNSSETIGVTKHIKAGQDIRVFAERDIHLRSDNDVYVHGENRLVLTAQSGAASFYAKENLYIESDKQVFSYGPDVTVGATNSIKLKVGTSEILMTPKDITINGVSLNLYSSKKTAIESIVEVALKGAQTNIGSSASITEIGGSLINLAAAVTNAITINMLGFTVGGGASTSTQQPPVPQVVDPTDVLQIKLAAILDFISIQLPELLPFFGESAIAKLIYTNTPPTSLSELRAKAAAEIDLETPPLVTTA